MVSMQKQSGFSLVELSIVLVILGLLVGGVLAGQSLIRAAEVRAVSTEYSRLSAAIMTFRDKYFALPGDITNATAFWGGGLASCQNTVGTGTATCNGDGDGFIDYWNYSTGTAVDSHFEGVRVWQHLANAGLVEGRYTGADAVSGGLIDLVPDVNVPRSKIGDMWYVYSAPTPSFRNWAPNISGNFLAIAGTTTTDPLLSTTEAWNIDTKLDDGKPYTGLFQDIRNESVATQYTPNCTTTQTTSADYNLTVSGLNCAAYIQF